MILILTSSGDVHVDFVQEWLSYYNYNYIRLNSDDLLLKDIKISLNNNGIYIDKKEINVNDINVIWYRKPGWFTRSEQYSEFEKNLDSKIVKQLYSEFLAVINALFSCFKSKYWITNYEHVNINKFEVLRIANECGLSIPSSYIVSTKDNLIELLNNGKSFISKSIWEMFFLKEKDGLYNTLTRRINLNELSEFPNTFFPSFIQEEIKKEYEIRIFYFLGRFYSMAIFSQSKESTEIDFRNDDFTNPSRQIPIILPEGIKTKIHKLMKRLKLNNGSIDMIKSTNGLYYFLEINPVGQFGMVGFPCNYSIFNDIAKDLIKIDRKYGKTKVS